MKIISLLLKISSKKWLKNNELLEFAQVFGNNYGTPRKLVEKRISEGKDVLFDIDWQGTQALRELEPKHLVSVFILPPSTQELEKRLQSRGQDSPEEVKKECQLHIQKSRIGQNTTI